MLYSLRSLQKSGGCLRVRCPECAEKRDVRLEDDERRKAFYCQVCRTPYIVEVYEDGLVQVA